MESIPSIFPNPRKHYFLQKQFREQQTKTTSSTHCTNCCCNIQ